MKRTSIIYHTTKSRSAFTLLELLTVISIISILIALLAPSVLRSLSSAEATAVATELTQLDQALTSFQAKFNRHPPSSITLYADLAGWNGDPTAKSAIRSLWRDFDFNTGGRGTGAHPWGLEDIQLSGDECLVFFLSGIPVPNGTATPTLTGFSVDPRQPFQVGGSRIDPFFTGWKDRENRLVDPDNDEIFSYTDGLSESSTPIAYSVATRGRYTGSQSAYFQADGTTPWNPETFQLIAPGEDGQLGTIPASGKIIWSEGINLPEGRRVERDNITNFAGKTLQ